jgi:hypothetical protein
MLTPLLLVVSLLNLCNRVNICRHLRDTDKKNNKTTTTTTTTTTKIEIKNENENKWHERAGKERASPPGVRAAAARFQTCTR